MPGLDPPSAEYWRKRDEEAEKNFDMVVAGAGMVLLSIILGILHFIQGSILRRKQKKREELLANDLEISRQGKIESVNVYKELKGQPDCQEKMLEAYRSRSTTKGKVWMGGFWSRIPNPIKRYIEAQYERHPEWLESAETGWW